MRLTDRLTLVDVSDDPDEEGRWVLIDEVRGDRVNFDVEDLARLLVLPLYFAAVFPPLKEAVIARLLDLDDERRAIIGRVVRDAAEDIRRHEEGTP